MRWGKGERVGWFFRVFDTRDECARAREGGVGRVCVVETV